MPEYDLIELQSEAEDSAKRLGIVYRTLSKAEMDKFEKCFQRSFVVNTTTKEISEIHVRHMGEIMLGAMIAKAQMEAEIDGEMPGSGKIGGPIEPRACFFGVGDDWEDAGSITTGSPQSWIHSGTTLMAGTSGNAVKIGENAVHVLIGVQSRHPSPKIESLKFEVDGKEKPVVVLGLAQKATVGDILRIKEFSDVIILKKTSTLLAQVFASATWGATITDYPVLVGASFVKEAQLRILDAANVTGTTQDVVMTT